LKLTLHQKQTQTQQLQLSPMLLQSLQILQMSNLQLVSHINAAAMENPLQGDFTYVSGDIGSSEDRKRFVQRAPKFAENRAFGK